MVLSVAAYCLGSWAALPFSAPPSRGAAARSSPCRRRVAVWADVQWVTASGETNTAWRHLHLYGDGKERRYFFDGAAPVRWGANYPDGNLADKWSGPIASFRVFNNKTKEEVPVRDLRIVPGDPGLPPELILSHAKASARWTPPGRSLLARDADPRRLPRGADPHVVSAPDLLGEGVRDPEPPRRARRIPPRHGRPARP